MFGVVARHSIKILPLSTRPTLSTLECEQISKFSRQIRYPWYIVTDPFLISPCLVLFAAHNFLIVLPTLSTVQRRVEFSCQQRNFLDNSIQAKHTISLKSKYNVHDKMFWILQKGSLRFFWEPVIMDCFCTIMQGSRFRNWLWFIDTTML